LLLLFLWVLAELHSYAEEAGARNGILAHPATYFQMLMQMDQPPIVTLAEPATQEQKLSRLIRVAKYDVTKIGARGIGGGINFYSLEREVVLGQQMAKDVESQSRLLNDPVITGYVNRIGQQLVRHSDAKVPFTI